MRISILFIFFLQVFNLGNTSKWEAESMADLTNDLGVCVLQILSTMNHGNVAFSPYGLATVSILLYEGAGGNTGHQIFRALNLPWDIYVARVGFRDINRHLKTYFQSDGFLRGLIMSRDVVCLHYSYQELLRLYGFEEPDNSLTYPCIGFSPYPPTTTSYVVSASTPTVTSTQPPSTSNGSVVTEMTQTSQTITVYTTTTESSNTSNPSSNSTSISGQIPPPDMSFERILEILAGSATKPDKSVVSLTKDLPPTSMLDNPPSGSSSTSTGIPFHLHGNMGTTESILPLEKVNISTVDLDSSPSISKLSDETKTSKRQAQYYTQSMEDMDKFSTTISEVPTEIDEDTNEYELSTLDNEISNRPQYSALTNQIPDESEFSTSNINDMESLGEYSSGMSEVPETTYSGSVTEIPNDNRMRHTEFSTSNELSNAPLVTFPSSNTEALDYLRYSTSISDDRADLMDDSPSNSIMDNTTPATSIDSTIPYKQTMSFLKSHQNIDLYNENVKTDNHILPKKSVSLHDAGQRGQSRQLHDPKTIYWSSRIIFPSYRIKNIFIGKDGNKFQNYDHLLEVKIIRPKNTKLRPKRSSASRSARSLTHHYWLNNHRLHEDYIRISEADSMWFAVNANSRILVPNFTYSAILPYAYLPDLSAKVLQLPLDDERYNLLLILPTHQYGLKLLLSAISYFPLKKICNRLTDKPVDAVIPKFHVISKIDLRPAMQQLGVRDVFYRYLADLSKMSPDERLYVRSIEQVITISVTKYPSSRIYEVPPTLAENEFIASHPFIYFVIDRDTKTSLVAGIMMNPTKH